MKLTVLTNSLDETIDLGRRIGKLLKPGDVIALYGDLGAGKTTLTRGIADGLGLEADIHSPTFTLIHEHPGIIPLYHVDLYRLSGEYEVEALGLDEYLYSDGVTIIEWADRTAATLPADRLDIDLKIADNDHRKLLIKADSARFETIIEALNGNTGD